MNFLISIINIAAEILAILVLVHLVLFYLVPVTNPIRITISKIVEPMLKPIRERVRPIAGIDFSPVILILLIQLLRWVLRSLLS